MDLMLVIGYKVIKSAKKEERCVLAIANTALACAILVLQTFLDPRVKVILGAQAEILEIHRYINKMNRYMLKFHPSSFSKQFKMLSVKS